MSEPVDDDAGGKRRRSSSMVATASTVVIASAALLGGLNQLVGEGGKTAALVRSFFGGTAKPPAKPDDWLTSASTAPSGLRYLRIAEGEGPHPAKDDLAVMNYEMTLTNGTLIDSAGNDKMTGVLPVGSLIPGFEEGLRMMRAGAEYRFWIPASLAYGKSEPGSPVPPDSDLIAHVKLLQIVPSAERNLAAEKQAAMDAADRNAAKDKADAAADNKKLDDIPTMEDDLNAALANQ